MDRETQQCFEALEKRLKCHEANGHITHREMELADLSHNPTPPAEDQAELVFKAFSRWRDVHNPRQVGGFNECVAAFLNYLHVQARHTPPAPLTNADECVVCGAELFPRECPHCETCIPDCETCERWSCKDNQNLDWDTAPSTKEKPCPCRNPHCKSYHPDRIKPSYKPLKSLSAKEKQELYDLAMKRSDEIIAGVDMIKHELTTLAESHSEPNVSEDLMKAILTRFLEYMQRKDLKIKPRTPKVGLEMVVEDYMESMKNNVKGA